MLSILPPKRMKFKQGDNIVHDLYGSGIVVSDSTMIYDRLTSTNKLAYIIETPNKFAAFEEDLKLKNVKEH